MDLSVSVINHLIALQNHHIKIINNNNEIIAKILREISAISSRRKEINKNLVDYFAKEMWLSNCLIILMIPSRLVLYVDFINEAYSFILSSEFGQSL